MISNETVREITPEISRLLTISFSEIERVPDENIARTFGRGGELTRYSDDGEFVGITFTFSEDDRTFFIYFATEPGKRSKGYGAKILSLLKESLKGQRVFLVTEPCDDDAEDIEIRRRRHGFYLRNGCSDTGYQVISDDALFDTMFVQGTLTEEEMVDTIRVYEDMHNGRI